MIAENEIAENDSPTEEALAVAAEKRRALRKRRQEILYRFADKIDAGSTGVNERWQEVIDNYIRIKYGKKSE